MGLQEGQIAREILGYVKTLILTNFIGKLTLQLPVALFLRPLYTAMFLSRPLNYSYKISVGCQQLQWLVIDNGGPILK